MNYAEMSDFEINRLVGNLMFKGLWACKPGTSGNETDSWYYGDADASFMPLNPLPDYCNNPTDGWRIITGGLISIRPIGVDGCLWEACGINGVKADYDKNPLRAAMVVFLMMKEGE